MSKVFATVTGQKYETSISKEFEAVTYGGKDYLLFELTERYMRLIPYEPFALIKFDNIPPLLGSALSSMDGITVDIAKASEVKFGSKPGSTDRSDMSVACPPPPRAIEALA